MMRAFPGAIAVLAVVATGHAAPASSTPAADRFEQAVRAVDAERVRLRIPGAALVIVDHDRVVVARGLGVRDLATGAPVDSLTLFPIGSCTKAFTGMAAVRAEADGRLALDDPPRRWLPWFRMADPEADALVTIRDLLSHRTGLLEYADLAAEPGVLTRTEYLEAATAAEPIAPFRSSFHYSNAMVVAAGECVGRAYGTTWEKAIERRLLEPLGMTRTVASLVEMRRFENRAIGYEDTSDVGVRAASSLPRSLDALAPAGAIAACARDMGRWLRFLLAEGTIDGVRLAPAEAVREAFAPAISVTPTLSYGFGWALHDWNGHRVVEHTGGSAGLSAIVSFVPEAQLGFAILVDTSPTPLTRIGVPDRMLWPILMGEEPRDAAAPQTPRRNRGADADTAALDTTGLPGAEELLARMTQAAGGRTNLARRSALTWRAERAYRNQGVTSTIETRWQAPDRRVDEETLVAAGRRIGRVRAWYDGRAGGQETTFDQDQEFAGEGLARAQLDATLDWFAQPGGLRVRVTGRTREADPAYVVETRRGEDAPTTYRVSVRTALVRERLRGRRRERFSDFRNVGGRVLPFHADIADELGESEWILRDVEIDPRVVPDAFRRGAPRAP